MSPITLQDFPAYFQELHTRVPYDWQYRLVEQVMTGSWPRAIDLPTGSGKTSCLDIAIFALACQSEWPNCNRTAPRRIFFCVNRRVIVDEAHQRAVRIARKLAEAEGSDTVLGRVAASLRSLSTLRKESAPPLDVLELRGGIYRDNRWARSATHPTILCTTIDQLGSRLLFRGYGVSPNAAPIHAALIAYDSLVLLDEAHISRPFLETLDFVKRYLNPEKWAEQPVGVKPMIVVPMTATPPKIVSDADIFRLGEKDRENPGLNKRLTASKKSKLRAASEVVNAAVSEATTLASEGPTAVGIIVNRVVTAKEIYAKLREDNKDNPDAVIELVIGSMRPIDRDRQAERLQELIGPGRPNITEKTSYIIATQCLEVGADYDFDVLVTECASLDALRQRFGRLNRGGREIDARAVILVDEKATKAEDKLDDTKPLDPIYGNALSRTWHWLRDRAQVVQEEIVNSTTPTRGKSKEKSVLKETHQIDFGISAFQAILQVHGEKDQIPARLLSPSASKNAPVMLPAYVDFWCQTSPHPTPDPEPALFIHGPQSGEPDVQVCWRIDLVEDGHNQRKHWCDVVSLLPPTSAECMNVPISRVRKWLASETLSQDSDLFGAEVADQSSERKKRNEKSTKHTVTGVLWRGSRNTKLMQSPDELRPGDTLVLPASAQGWDELGHIPAASLETVDIAEQAFEAARDRAALRLHPTLRNRFPDTAKVAELFSKIDDPEDSLTLIEIQNLLEQIADEIGTDHFALGEKCKQVSRKSLGLLHESYPDGRGLVLITRRKLKTGQAWMMPDTDEGDDALSGTIRELPISLIDHTRHVYDEVEKTIDALQLDELKMIFTQAADWHDLGKADERFQAMLRRTDCTDTWLWLGASQTFLAKSDGLTQTRPQKKQARDRAGLPEGFRHEMLSVQLVEQVESSAQVADQFDLILHLIAAHHGYARPFAPVVVDEETPEITVNDMTLTSEQRRACPPHRIDSGIAERFWALTQRYGWWGLAYLEAILRLADQQASADAELLNSEERSKSLEAITS